MFLLICNRHDIRNNYLNLFGAHLQPTRSTGLAVALYSSCLLNTIDYIPGGSIWDCGIPKQPMGGKGKWAQHRMVIEQNQGEILMFCPSFIPDLFFQSMQFHSTLLLCWHHWKRHTAAHQELYIQLDLSLAIRLLAMSAKHGQNRELIVSHRYTHVKPSSHLSK